MEVWIVLNGATNIFAGVYDSLENARKAVVSTYYNKTGGRAKESVTFTPAIASNTAGNPPPFVAETTNNQVTYTTQYGDTGTIIRQMTAKIIGADQLYGF